MLEIIALFFLCRKNGQLAIQKGLVPRTWKWYTILAWIAGEFLGVGIGVSLFGMLNLVGILSTGIFTAFGGYLLVRYILENKPDSPTNSSDLTH